MRKNIVKSKQGTRKMRTIKEYLAYKLFNNTSVKEMAFLVMLFLIAYA